MDQERPQGRNRTNARLIVLLVLVTALAFLPVFTNDFVSYDDEDYLTKNAVVRQGLSPASVRWAFSTGRNSNWHPITWLSHLLDVSIFGLRPSGHHAVSLLLHAASAVLLYLLLLRLTGWTYAAGLTAAFFAVHPLHVESVAWAAERKDVLSGFFFMLALTAWTKHVGSVSPTRRSPLPATKWYILSVVFFAVGLMSKPMVVTFPFVLLLLDHWPWGRLAAVGGEPGKLDWRRFGSLVLEKTPFLVLAAISSIVTFMVQQASGAVRATDLYPMSVRLGNAVTAMATYLGKTLLPIDLSVIYPHLRKIPSPGRFAVAATVLLACSFAASLAGKHRPQLFTGWWWFVGMLVPVLGLIQVGPQALADRYTYLPLIGVFLALAVEWEKFARRSPRLGWSSAGVAAAVVVMLGILTFRQAAVWRNSVTLFKHAVKGTDNNWLAELNLGYALNREGQVKEGLRHLKEAARMRPDFGRTHQMLGMAADRGGKGRPSDAVLLAEQRNPAEAEALLREALAVDPAAAEVRYKLAMLLMRMGRGKEAAEEFRDLLRSGSMVSEACNNLGVLEEQGGRIENAEGLFRRAIDSGPDNPRAYNNFGAFLVRLGRLDEAYPVLREALSLQPTYVAAMNNLADALRAGGHTEEAAFWYRTTLEIDQRNERARSGLAATGEQR